MSIPLEGNVKKSHLVYELYLRRCLLVSLANWCEFTSKA